MKVVKGNLKKKKEEKKTLYSTVHYLTAHVVCSEYLKTLCCSQYSLQGTTTKESYYNTVLYELIQFQYSCKKSMKIMKRNLGLLKKKNIVQNAISVRTLYRTGM